MKKFVLIALVLLVVAPLLALWLLRGWVVDKALAVVREEAAASGIVFDYRERQVSFDTLTLRDVRVDGLAQRVPISLRIEQLGLAPSWPDILSGQVGVVLAAKMYRGEASARIAINLVSRTLSLSGFVERLELSDHPLVRATGIERGQLSLRIPSLRWEESGSTGSFELELIRLGKSSPTEISHQGTLMLTVPPFDRVGLQARGGISPEASVFRPIEIQSDFGSANGNFSVSQHKPGRVSVNRRTGPSLNGRLEVALSAAGQQVFGPWLPVISKGAIPATSSDFTVTLAGSTSAPDVVVTLR